MLPVILFFALAGDAVGCPASIDVKQQLSAPVPGWAAGRDPAPHQFAGLTFFDGKPEDQASLAPDGRKRVGGRQVQSWTFGPAGRPVWVVCRYAATSVILSRQLPKNIRGCSVTYSANETIDGLPVIEKVECR